MYRRGEGWLTMQLVDGGTAAELDQLDDRLTAMNQIADALDYVHSRGIVHCDVKPSNVLVYKDFSHAGSVLTDFGVAYAVAEDWSKRPQPLVASLPYLAPEMLRGRPPAAATDEYALACTTVELVTGAPPFVAGDAAALAQAQLNRPPPYPSRTLGGCRAGSTEWSARRWPRTRSFGTRRAPRSSPRSRGCSGANRRGLATFDRCSRRTKSATDSVSPRRAGSMLAASSRRADSLPEPAHWAKALRDGLATLPNAMSTNSKTSRRNPASVGHGDDS